MTFLELTPKAQARAALDYAAGYYEQLNPAARNINLLTNGAMTLETAFDLCADPTIQEEYDYDQRGKLLAIQGELF